MSGHTPGPWAVAKRLACFDGDQVISVMTEADVESGMVVWPSGFRHTDNAKANALLIASAPDLLEALKAIVPFIPVTSAKEGGASAYSENVRAADKVRAAIAAATVEQA